MKTRLLNRCKNCGHTWFPRGFDLSRECPDCGGGDVDMTGRLYLALLVGLAVAAGIFWATDRPHKPARSAAASPSPASPHTFMKHRHVAQATPAMPEVRPVIRTEAEGRREALRLYPDLGVANSPLNREFVARYRSYQRLQPDIFQDPAWPVILVKESAVAIGEPRTVR